MTTRDLERGGVGGGVGGNSYMCSQFGCGFVLLLMVLTVLPKGAVFATCVNEFAKLSILQKLIDTYEVQVSHFA